MGKQTNAQVLRFLKNEDWVSKYYSSNYNYSNFIVQDNLIRNYVIHFISYFNTKVAQIYIYRKKHEVIIRVFSYNDSFTNWKSYLLKHRKKINYRNNSGNLSLKGDAGLFRFGELEDSYNWFKPTYNLRDEVLFFRTLPPTEKILGVIFLATTLYSVVG